MILNDAEHYELIKKTKFSLNCYCKDTIITYEEIEEKLLGALIHESLMRYV